MSFDSKKNIAPLPGQSAGAPGLVNNVMAGNSPMALEPLRVNSTVAGLASTSAVTGVIWQSQPLADLAAFVQGTTLNVQGMASISGTNDADDDLGLDLQWVNSAGTATSIAKATISNCPAETVKLLRFYAMARVLTAGATGALVGGIFARAQFGTAIEGAAVSAITGVTSLDLSTYGGYFRILGDWPTNTGASTTVVGLCVVATLHAPNQ